MYPNKMFSLHKLIAFKPKVLGRPWRTIFNQKPKICPFLIQINPPKLCANACAEAQNASCLPHAN